MSRARKLPNGFGSIRYLGKGRKNPYIVLPPSSIDDTDNKGVPRYKKALAYAKSYSEAFSILVMYHNGTWTADSTPLDVLPNGEKTKYIESLASEILRKIAPKEHTEGITFEEVGRRYLDEKFNSKKELSVKTIRQYKSVFNSLSDLYTKPINGIKYAQLQDFINSRNVGYTQKSHLILLIKQVFKYACKYELIDKDASVYLDVNIKNDTIHGENFTIEELKKIYDDRQNETSQMILILVYSGFRIGEIESLEIDLINKTFKGGIKTKASKNRLVPIHSFIFDMVAERYNKNSNILFTKANAFRKAYTNRLEELGIKKHRLHDTRHTFSYLCTKFEVDEIQKRRLLGHSFKDVTNGVYGHTDINILRSEIERIKPISEL